ncbi:MAG: hypothetical protein GY710_05020 [Desulfobacteraceae bacterium]|nr:hypothetical protein [Desulfobacteraceae bacterium]
MKHSNSIIANEKGSAIVFALLALSILSIIGISSTNTTTTELNIVRNEQIYQTNFYLAESSAYEAALRIENETDPFELIPDSSDHNWLNDDIIDFSVTDNWNDEGQASADVNDNSDSSQFNANASYATVAKGPREGSSLDISSTRLYEFAVFGRSDEFNGNVLVEIGYLKKF